MRQLTANEIQDISDENAALMLEIMAVQATAPADVILLNAADYCRRQFNPSWYRSNADFLMRTRDERQPRVNSEFVS